jgi:hypothetical protein
MKTEALIKLLAAGPELSTPAPPAWRNTLLIVVAVLLSTVLMMTLLGLRQDLFAVAMQPTFVLKVVFAAALVMSGKIAITRLSLPGASLRMLPVLIATPLLIMTGMALMTLASTAPAQRAALFWGDTWQSCSLIIAGLSLPIFAAILIVMRDLAPTRLRLAGAAAGFTAGATAAVVYCLHCPEVAAPFVAFWYVLGMVIPAGLGAVIGPRVLRW